MKNDIFFHSLLCVITALLILPVSVTGQTDSSHVQFHGSNTLVGQYSNMQSIGSEIPPSFYRNDLKMNLTVYDVPISASFFLTSLQKDYRQSINNFRIYLDVAALLKTKKLADAKSLASSTVSKLESAQEELGKYKIQLNTSVLDNVKDLEILQEEYDKAEEKLADATSKGQQEVEKARARYDDLQAKLAAAQAKVDEYKAKLAGAEASLEQVTAQLEQAKSLATSPDLAKNAESYAKGKGMSKAGRFLTNFTTLEIGKCRPNYSELTLKGIAVSGTNIEFTPGMFYSAFAMGKVKRPIMPSVHAKPAFKQSLIFGKIGVGRKNESHFYITYMQVEEDVNSLPADLGLDSLHIDTLRIRPRANTLLGTEAKLALFKKKFTIEGEFAVSLLTRDTQSPGLGEYIDVPKWLNDLLKPNMSSSADFAYDVRSTLNLETTIVTVGLKMVGPGYVSLGNPNLINDRVTYEGRIDQTLVKNQVTLSGYYRQSHDNLIDWKKGTTDMMAYGFIAGLRFPKLPYLQFSYTPYFQKTESDSFKLDNSVRVISASTGYNYQIGKLRSNSMFSFFYQKTETILDSTSINSRNSTYTVNEELAFTIPLSLAAGVSFNQFEFTNISRNVLILSLSGTYGAFKNKWKNSLGVKYASQDYQQDKLGFCLNSMVQLWKMVDLEIRIEKNTYRDNLLTSSNYKQFMAQAKIVVKW